MRALGAKKGIGIGLAVVLVAVSLGGWLLLRSDGGEDEPIVVGVTDQPDFLDPSQSYTASAWDLYSNVYQGLLTIGPGSDEPVPDAAESCEFTDTAHTVYRCTLREGITFSSGREMEPEDVKFSIERILEMSQRAEQEADDPAIAEGEAFQFSGPIPLLRGVSAVRVDGQDVIFELEESDVTFPYVLAGGAGSIVDREEYETDEPTDHVVGSGPFRLDSYRPYEPGSGEYGVAELVPNEEYDGALRIPDHPVTIQYYEDAAELGQGWDDRTIDVNAGRMNPEDILEIDRNDLDIRYSETTGMSIRTLVLRTDEDHVLGDPVVRHAIASLLDRDAIARDARLHTMEPAYSLIPVGVTGHGTPYFDLYTQRTADEVADALEAAGYTEPISFSLGFASGTNQAENETIAQQLEADGLFEVEVRQYDSLGEAIDEEYVEGNLDAYTVGWRPDFADPDTYTDALLNQDSTLMHNHHNENVMQLIGNTRSEGERGATGELFREIHQLAAEDALVIPLTQDRNYAVAVREITGLQYLRDAAGQFRLWDLSRL